MYCKAGYDLGDGSKTANHLIFMDDLKLHGKNEYEVDSLVQTVRIFTKDIQMKFGISKCVKLIIRRGKATKCEGVVILGGKIRTLNYEEECESCKYLGVLQADDIKHKEMKKKISKEYFRKVRMILNEN